MDGYALRVGDVPAAGTVLPISQRIAAGSVGVPLAPGTAARIFTGAQSPARRRCRRHAGAVHGASTAASGSTSFQPPAMAIRRRGEDVGHGAVVLAAGQRLSPQALGMAASVGAATLSVGARPRVALFSTGDELAMPGETLKPGAIYNSNRFTLRGLIESLGGRHDDLGIIADRLDATRAALEARGREQRPDRHLRRRLGRRGRPPQACGRAGRPARPLADRDQAGQAARVRRGLSRATVRRRGSSACRAIRCRASSPSCSRSVRCC